MTIETHLLRVNEAEHSVQAGPATPLLFILRNDLQLNGPKFGCGLGECGACLILVGDRPVRACTTPVGAIFGQSITTLEGLSQDGELHPVQAAFVAHQAAQCGYCLNGMIMATVALLKRHPQADEAAIRKALARHLCRCGTHLEILAAVRAARDAMLAASKGGAREEARP